jgi:putative N6-adenine-specific DNA methylase
MPDPGDPGPAGGPPSTTASGRGAAKLRAAVERFGLAPVIAGSRCLDVGAGTGDFIAVLLETGAIHVTAADVGRNQLDPALRGDEHVTLLEGVHFKTLSLDVAPGPFDFFAVDVSFITARSMVRSLAFRVRPGAEGVILVKPQFELPPGRARAAAGHDDPLARQAALDLLRAKAAPLGFTLLHQAPSPVPGARGTVELLTHWRFEGRTALLPPPPGATGAAAGTAAAAAPAAAPAAEDAAAAAPAAAAAAAAAPAAEDSEADTAAPSGWRLFAVAAPGLERVVAAEVRALGDAGDVQEVPGGVEFRGDVETIWRANLWLRVATRVTARLGEVRARDFSRLRRGLGRLPWGLVTDGPRRVVVSATAHECRLYHTGALAENVELAVVDALGQGAVAAAESEAPALPVYLRGVGDAFTVSIDTSGELLHRRGWRTEAGEAPLRETLAAGLLALASWDPRTPLVDPCCGSGTIVIEAAALAAGLAPGAARHFAFEAWPSFDAERWGELRAEASGTRAASLPPLLGFDTDADVIVAARHNAARAGLADHVRLGAQPLSEAAPPPGAAPGLVLTNLPYGRRSGDRRDLPRLYRALLHVLRTRFSGWRLGVLTADRTFTTQLRLRPAATHPLVNGGLRVVLHLYSL